MTEDQYLTLSSPSEGLYKEKGSKFLSFAFPITSQEEVKEKVNTFKKTYYDARHVCYAYSFGFPQTDFKGSDGGEPPHTAGDPILGQIKSRNLINTLVIVVRYFGGTKLGASGLIHAYKTAAHEALEVVTTIQKLDTDTMVIRFTYPQMNQVMKLVKDFDLTITKQSLEMECELEVAVRKTLTAQVSKRLEEEIIDHEVV